MNETRWQDTREASRSREEEPSTKDLIDALSSTFHVLRTIVFLVMTRNEPRELMGLCIYRGTARHPTEHYHRKAIDRRCLNH